MATKTDRRGIYRKFDVRRTDGSSRKGKRHHGCAYFVLDLDHDEFAYAALEAYAKACRATHPGLAADIMDALKRRPCGCRSAGDCPHWVEGFRHARLHDHDHETLLAEDVCTKMRAARS